MEEIRQRMIVVGGERVGSWQSMLPSRVVWCKSGVRRMESVAVKGVRQNLDQRALDE